MPGRPSGSQAAGTEREKNCKELCETAQARTTRTFGRDVTTGIDMMVANNKKPLAAPRHLQPLCRRSGLACLASR